MLKNIYLLLLLIMLCFVKSSNSQTFDPINDNKISYRNEFNILYGFEEKIEYAKHWLSPTLYFSNLNNKVYLTELFNFVKLNNSKIIELYIDSLNYLNISDILMQFDVRIILTPKDWSTNGTCTLRLCDTMDAFNYFDYFLKSGYFEKLDFFPVNRLNDNFYDQ